MVNCRRVCEAFRVPAMTIEWFGQTCFRLTAGELTIVIDPFSSASGLRLPKLTADLLLLTNGESEPTAVHGEPLTVDGPGEYEVKRAFVYGLPTRANGGQAVTMYLIEHDGISYAHLGPLGHQLANGELERLEGVDVLFVPVGGHGVLNADQASTLISAVEPRIIIPMAYHRTGLKQKRDGVTPFAKEMGVKESAAVEKLKLTAKDLPQDTTQVVVIQS